MWNLKCTIIPVIIGATGIVKRSLRKNLETVPGKHSIDSLQKTTVLWTSHIIRKVLQCEAWSLSGGDHCWFKRSTRKKCLWQETSIIIIITIIINKCEKFLYLIQTQNNLFNNPCKSCFNNNLQHQFNAIFCFGKLWESNDFMIQVFRSNSLTILTVCVVLLCLLLFQWFCIVIVVVAVAIILV